MGVLDEVLCNNDMFGNYKGETHYTTSLDPVFPGSTYEITPAGRLEILECTYEDRSDPNAQGLERLIGSLTPVFNGKRRDIGPHGWINFPGFGRAKFTDGNLEAFEPGDHALSQDSLMTSIHSPSYGEQSSLAAEDPAEYLRQFFSELERLKVRLVCDVSHAIGFRDGKLYVLMSVGDLRERVYVEDLDKDPAIAAQDVYLSWRTIPQVEEEIE